MTTYTWLITFSVIIIASFTFNLISKKSGIPSVLMLMISGIAIKAIYPASGGMVNQSIMEILGTIGLILIVLEASLDLSLKKENNARLLKAAISAMGLLVVGILLVGVLFHFTYDTTWIKAVIYAVPISVMSSAIVIPSINSLQADKKEFMIYESSFSDIFGIVIFYFCVDLGGPGDTTHIAALVGTKTLLTILGSVAVSYGLVYLFHKLRSEVKLFLLMAVLILIYALGKTLHLSSLILIMVFGLVLNNYDFFFRGFLTQIISKEDIDKITDNLHAITLESAFLIKTFFFVAFGISINLIDLADPFGLITALVISLIIYGTRYLTMSSLSGKKSIFPETLITPRGLITVLLFFAIPKEFAIEGFSPGIILGIIFTTNLVMTFGIIKYKNQKLEAEEEKFTPIDPEGITLRTQGASESEEPPTAQPE